MKKVLALVATVGLSASLIYGATQAWFTDQKDIAAATFTAGTVIIEAGEEYAIDPMLTENVNPGDTFEPKWTFINQGTKAVVIRILPDITYLDKDEEPSLSTDNIDDIILPAGWRSEIEEDRLVLYYNHAIPGTYGQEDPDSPDAIAARTATLTFPVTFNGELTDNAYQGSTLTVTGIIQAVQASHQGEGGWNWADLDWSEFNPTN